MVVCQDARTKQVTVEDIPWRSALLPDHVRLNSARRRLVAFPLVEIAFAERGGAGYSEGGWKASTTKKRCIMTDESRGRAGWLWAMLRQRCPRCRTG